MVDTSLFFLLFSCSHSLWKCKQYSDLLIALTSLWKHKQYSNLLVSLTMPGDWFNEPHPIGWECFKDNKRRDPYQIKHDDGDYMAVWFVTRCLEREYASEPREQRDEALTSAVRVLFDNPYELNRQQLDHTLREGAAWQAVAKKCDERDAEDMEERHRCRTPQHTFKFDMLWEAQAKIGLEYMGVIDCQWRILAIDQASLWSNLMVCGKATKKFLVARVCDAFQYTTGRVE